ncbi:Ctr-domain-containing protein [Aaosphaeria arxii CBS 175.79]|uniref:Copper transport protein n=1 Tax=Aaosphaeria arxii CBS 175.79 TaxID=1450172 RepID=A0A6A5XKB0_9PLEO|nr:Ctr-domain-containing protein [Aaosphaeria arxii CBS 175.79]KAF2013291.1 Ctr-domain-containing protein [Aaosphaeria arxii CBS 175.79]
MDHSHMDHGGMDHGGHGGHDMPGMGGGHKCNMNMLFTWDTKDLCIVFHGWHIDGTASLIFSLLAIVLMTAGYEAVRELSRRYDLYAKSLSEGRRSGDDLTSDRAAQCEDDATESSSLLNPGRLTGRPSEQQTKIIKAILYAVQVFYSFFIMLLFMTYNGWVMFAVAVGAFVGYLLFSNSSPTKTAACH